jgi:hypothetical protein
MLDSWMARRRSWAGRFPWGPLLALSASCLWGCPQLLSDDFLVLTGPEGDQNPAVNGGGTGGSAGAGSAGAGPQPQNTAGAGGGAPVSTPGIPTVLSVSPSNGASGVPADQTVTVTFSEPMDTAKVEQAYSSSDLPASAVGFSWSADNTVLQIKPQQPLTLASGASPDTTQAQRYAFEIGTGAVDLDGEALARFSSSFTTLRQFVQTLTPVLDRNLSGNYRSDNTYGDNSCVFADPDGTICIGDSSNDNSAYRGFLTFDLSLLPAPAKGVSAAALSMSVDSIRNSPFAALGSLVAEHVSFSTINLAAFDAVALGSAVTMSSSATVNSTVSADVASFVKDDLPARGRSQLRLRFSNSTNSDGVGDLIEVLWDTPELDVTYLIP